MDTKNTSLKIDNFMPRGIDIIILDDDPIICELISNILKGFYTWGEIHLFTEMNKALSYVFVKNTCIGLYIVDVFLEEGNGFQFLDAIKPINSDVYNDAVMITGYANDDVVDMCLASGIDYLLEKPIKQSELRFTIRTIIEKYIRLARKLNKLRLLETSRKIFYH